MKVKILSKTENVFDGEAVSVSSYNQVGEFDILPRHANFISLIRQAVIIDKGLPTQQYIRIDEGVIRSFDDEVEIFI